MTCYIPIWFTCPQAATHPSTNRAQCRLTSLMKPTPLTTTLRRHLLTCTVSTEQTCYHQCGRYSEAWSDGLYCLYPVTGASYHPSRSLSIHDSPARLHCCVTQSLHPVIFTSGFFTYTFYRTVHVVRPSVCDVGGL